MRLLALLVPVALALPAGEAAAATFCVGTTLPGCVEQPDLAGAVAAAADAPGLDTIRIGRRTEDATVTDAPGEPVRVIGAGRRATELEGRVDLGEDRSSIAAVTVREPAGIALAVRGQASDLLVQGRRAAARRSDAAHLVDRGAGRDGGAGADAQRRGLGHGARRRVRRAQRRAPDRARVRAGRAACPRRRAGEHRQLDRLGLSEGRLRRGHDRVLAPAGERRSTRCSSPRRATCGCAPARRWSTPAIRGRSRPTSRRPTRSATSGPRTATATAPPGVTSARFERRPPPPPATAGNLLANPGAEQGTAAVDDTAAPAPPRWRRSGGFTSVRYGTVVGLVRLPHARGGRRAAGPATRSSPPGRPAPPRPTQVVDVSGWAPEIDARVGGRDAAVGAARRLPRAATTARW